MKEKLLKDLIEARGRKEYWRNEYNNAFFFDRYELAKYREWDEKVEAIEDILTEVYGVRLW